MKLLQFRVPLMEKIEEVRPLLEELRIKARRKTELDRFKEEKERLQYDVQSLKKEKISLLRNEELRREMILDDLEARSHHVFKKDELTDDQISALLEDGYQQNNEFCVYEKKTIAFLIKPKLNHSATHTFLVWSTKKFLETIKEIRYIDENLTKDADLVFKYDGKEFALEIETGSLLGKRAQTEEKIKLLNRKYGKRWMFIVSNKNLLPKYRKLGFSTQRSDVDKSLKKLLKNY